MESGIVKWYSESRGVGIIMGDRGQGPVNVSHAGIASDGFKILYEGQKVWFDTVQTSKGPAAAHVTTDEDADLS